MPDVAVFTALAWERRAVTAALAGVRPRAGRRSWEGRLGDGRSCLVVQAGIGLERAAAAVAAAPPARVLISCGCAGALAVGLGAGDLVVADAVVGPGGDAAPAAGAAALVGWAAGAGFRLHAGTVVSSPSVLAAPAAKAAAAARGLVVDMESAAVARAAAARGIPFVGLRVVLDAADQAVPESLLVVDERTGALRIGRAIAAIGLRPRHWPAAVRLARQTRRADARLRAFLRALLARDGLGRALSS